MTRSATPAQPVNDFDEDYALAKVGDVVEDIGRVDERMLDGIAVRSALDLLSDSFGRVASAGTPPGVDPASYMSRLQTLESFTASAADEAYEFPVQAAARYAAVRKETRVLLDQINSAMGSQFRLP